MYCTCVCPIETTQSQQRTIASGSDMRIAADHTPVLQETPHGETGSVVVQNTLLLETRTSPPVVTCLVVVPGRSRVPTVSTKPAWLHEPGRLGSASMYLLGVWLCQTHEVISLSLSPSLPLSIATCGPSTQSDPAILHAVASLVKCGVMLLTSWLDRCS